MKSRRAIGRVVAVGIPAVLVIAAAVGIYYYTSPPTSVSTQTSPVTTSATGSTSSVSAPSPGGTQDSSGQPQGAWAAYLGYIPTGYVLAPHYPGAAVYPCPSGMDQAQCKQFQASCGNGVCDPNESCATCPLDCGVSGQLTCDPYTGRAGAPVSICQAGGLG